MSRQRLLRRNIVLLRMFRCVMFFMPMIPTLVMYFKANGMTMADVMLLQSIFSVMIVVIEIPSGYVSDVIGRTFAMRIGALFVTAGMAVYAFAHGFATFLVAEMVLAIGWSFISGTDAAMLYDTLQELGTVEQSIKEEGRQQAFGHLSEAASGIVSGLLVMVSLALPVQVEALVYMLTIPLSLLLIEPAEHRFVDRKASFADILSIVTRTLHHDSYMKWMIISSSVLGASTLTFVWMFQPLMKTAGIPITLFGVVWSGAMLVVALGSSVSHRLYQRLGPVRSIVLLGVFVITAYFILGSIQVWWIIPVALLMNFTRGASNPLFITELNKRTPSHERGTVLSIRQLGMRIVFVICAPLVGYISDVTSIGAALLACGCTFVILLTFSIVKWGRLTKYASS